MEIENGLPAAEGVVRPVRRPVGPYALSEPQRVALHLPQRGLGGLVAGRDGTVREQVSACRLGRRVPGVAKSRRTWNARLETEKEGFEPSMEVYTPITP